ncbi:FAD-dependent oxidoreductase [Sphingomonas xanthus]|uniref:FAD-dependent oxidoreductase n=1 Tax=Sphingomonas xanthus TaxID=2594473 RepID=A0A516IRJ0_9SPHN|nr:FAD-dependent oxidoreductase [Sphingomonas xanthus]QDP19526.1 FAD-dependent oxidoreductase [Sphingomonas xanthus]
MRIDCAGDAPEALTADVAIIGSGAAGQAAARRLLKHGCRVVIIESGGIDHEAEAADLNAGEIVGQPYHPLDHSRLRFFGGTTAVWGGRCAELDPIDFERRSWVPHSGWPIAPDDIAGEAEEARQMFGVERAAPPQQDSILNRFSPEELAVRWWSFDPKFDRFTIDRASDLESDPRCTLLIHATVREIIPAPDLQSIERLDIVKPDGRVIDVRARHFLLAAGGIENPRILLASNSVATAGLGNGHDLVGRYFMEHPHARGGRIIGRFEWQWLSAFAKRRVGGVEMSPAITPSSALQRREGLLNSAITVAVRQPEGGSHPLLKRAYLHVKHRTAPTRRGRSLWKATKQLVRGYTGAIGPLHPWAMKRLNNLDLALVVRAEQAPNPDSRVLLSDSRDASGMPRARLDWRLSAIDVDSVAGLVAAIGREAERLGLGTAEPATWLSAGSKQWVSDGLVSAHPIGGFHHMGTTRMADDPKRGVTDSWGKVHGLANLHIAGSSLFPTGGWANPTLTIVALALRTADRIAESIRRPAVRTITATGADGTTG